MQEGKHFTRACAKTANFLLGVTMRGFDAGQRHPFSFIANKKRYGGNARGHDSAPAAGRIFQHCRMRRKAAPSYSAGQAELIKHLRIVVAEAARKNVALPRARRDFKAL